jgi:hypothetical protein
LSRSASANFSRAAFAAPAAVALAFWAPASSRNVTSCSIVALPVQRKVTVSLSGSITYIDGQAPTGYLAIVAALPGFSVSIASQTKRSAYGASLASV